MRFARDLGLNFTISYFSLKFAFSFALFTNQKVFADARIGCLSIDSNFKASDAFFV